MRAAAGCRALTSPGSAARSAPRPSPTTGNRYRHTSQDRCHRLRAWSPYEETLRQRIIELTADATQYLVHDGLRQEARTTHWATLHAILAGAATPLTRAAIRQRWPHDPVPDDATVYRWLEEAIARGLAHKYGRGRRNDPFPYVPRDCPEGCSSDDR